MLPHLQGSRAKGEFVSLFCTLVGFYNGRVHALLLESIYLFVSVELRNMLRDPYPHLSCCSPVVTELQ